MREWIQRIAPAVIAAALWVWRGITSIVGLDELLIYAAIALLATGASKAWPPAGYLVPGLVMLWMYLPSRKSFIARPPADARKDA